VVLPASACPAHDEAPAEDLRHSVPYDPGMTRDTDSDRDRLGRAFVLSALFAIACWLVMIVEAGTGLELAQYGIYPRRESGLIGVLVAPFIHGSAAHLVSNTLPIVVLGTALLYGYPNASRIVIPALFLGSGLGVWLFGRASYHVGASGLTFGMMFFVFASGVLRWDRRAIGLSLAVFFLYGGMVWGVLPGDPQISYEAHLSGAITGLALAYLLRRLDPPPPPKRYSWENEIDELEAQANNWARAAALEQFVDRGRSAAAPPVADGDTTEGAGPRDRNPQ
jgi:membrane associated rhomboid family serine protease